MKKNQLSFENKVEEIFQKVEQKEKVIEDIGDRKF